MAKTKYVYSALTADNAYTNFENGAADLPNAIERVLIKGGANLPDARFNTHLAVMTEVSDEEVAYLKRNADFNRHLENGFVVIRDSKAEIDVVAADLAGRDGSSPLVPNDGTGAVGDEATDKEKAEAKAAAKAKAKADAEAKAAKKTA